LDLEHWDFNGYWVFGDWVFSSQRKVLGSAS
jgi:hypothetical protein